MKDLYKKLIIEGILILLSIFNIITNLIPTYGMVLILFFINLFFGKIIHKEKENKSSQTEVLLELITFLLTFFILYYLFGLLIGFTSSGNYYSLEGVFQTILPIILFSIERELLRNNLLNNETNQKYIYFTVLVFILLDIGNKTYYISMGETYTELTYFLLSLLPSITTNLTYSYISTKESWITISLYAIIISTYRYLLPIIPNSSLFLNTAINTILPILLWVRISSFYERESDEEYNIHNILILLLPTILVTILVYFYSGYFRYYAIAVATNSMNPTIERGDIVFIDQKIEDYGDLKVGEVITYKKNNYVIVHRIVDKRMEKGRFYFQAKGDKMEESEIEEVSEDMIIGSVTFRIKYLGYPTIWFNNV